MRVNNRYVSFYYENDNDMGAIEIDPKKTALLVVDMQHVFITRPALENPTPEELAEAERWEPFFSKIDSVVVPNNQRLLQAFRERNMNVCFAKIQCQKKDGSDRSLDQKATGYNELLLPPGTPSAEIVPELKPMEDEIVVTKTTDSVLAGTSLRLWLNNMGIDTVVVTGVLTDQCVSGTVRSLADESFKVWLIEDACMASTQRIQDNELEIITDSFKINKNIIELNSRIIQVCNIESISMVEPKKKGITIGVFIGFIIGLALLSYQPLVGTIVIGLSAFYIYCIVQGNKKLGKNLYINLVSGYYIVINFKNVTFAYKIMETIENYLNGSNESSVSINVQDSVITFGDDSPIYGNAK